jgi:hypothetical protein
MVMDHADALEQIEIAAAEPDGLERLMAGDTPEATLVAGHLAGCPACAAELVRIERTARLARSAIRDLPDPALRDRTLAFVRAVGRDRSAATVTVPAAVAALPPIAPVSLPAARAARRSWLAAGMAASLLIVAVLGFAAGGALRPAGSGGDNDAAAQAAVTATMMRIATHPDTVRITLASTTGGDTAGWVLFSPSSGEVAMLATGLGPAPAGTTYACWIESGGTRRRIGVLYADGGTGTWVGPVTGLADVPAGATFGISLVPAGGGTGTPVLQGS